MNNRVYKKPILTVYGDVTDLTERRPGGGGGGDDRDKCSRCGRPKSDPSHSGGGCSGSKDGSGIF